MQIALASPPYPKSIKDGLLQVENLVKDAATQKAEIICFPETYIPGYPLDLNNAEKTSPQVLKNALYKACAIANLYDLNIKKQLLGEIETGLKQAKVIDLSDVNFNNPRPAVGL